MAAVISRSELQRSYFEKKEKKAIKFTVNIIEF